MSLAEQSIKPDVTAALSRLLSDSALWRAAMGACPTPIAILDASTPERAVTYVNPAFEAYFGYRRGEAHGGPLAGLLFRGDEPLVHRLLATPGSRWQLKAWTRHDTLRHVELALGAVRNAEGRTTYWVVTFSDRSEAESLRAELDSMRPAAAAA
jgi:PAS domain S-box-containing protein